MPATYTCTNDQSKKFTQLCCDAIMVIYTCRHYTFTGIKISPAWNMATDSNWLPNLRASVSTFCAVMPDNQQWVAYAPFAEANGSKSPDIYNLIISRTWNVNITLIWYNILLAYHHRDGWSRRCTISDPWPKHCAPPQLPWPIIYTSLNLRMAYDTNGPDFSNSIWHAANHNHMYATFAWIHGTLLCMTGAKVNKEATCKGDRSTFN